jgi:hypothetical protein
MFDARKLKFGVFRSVTLWTAASRDGTRRSVRRGHWWITVDWRGSNVRTRNLYSTLGTCKTVSTVPWYMLRTWVQVHIFCLCRLFSRPSSCRSKVGTVYIESWPKLERAPVGSQIPARLNNVQCTMYSVQCTVYRGDIISVCSVMRGQHFTCTSNP